MTTNTNIYDIDDELVRAAGDNHKWTIEEAQEKIEYYRNKLKELDEKDPKAVIYATYMRNLSAYVMGLYAKMTPKEMEERALSRNLATKSEEVKKAMEELKNDLENGESNTEGVAGDDTNGASNPEVEQPVEDSTPSETIMDEYVPFEEIKDDEKHQIYICALQCGTTNPNS